jgi:hypothetical protein
LDIPALFKFQLLKKKKVYNNENNNILQSVSFFWFRLLIVRLNFNISP